MANYIDYLQWRGDLSFKQSAFNSVDNIILCKISYFKFENFIAPYFSEKAPSIPDACIFLLENLKKFSDDGYPISDEDVKFCRALIASQRFQKTKMTGYINHIDPVAEKQFSAVTFLTDDHKAFVAFRGTDNTLIGWKENFNMSFSDLIPAQTEAKKYLSEAISHLFWRSFRVGGHSKGGNLAVYASASVPRIKQFWIREIYANDSPGFQEKTLSNDGFSRISNKIQSFIPQSSLVGNLLHHTGHLSIIRSTGADGFFQHFLDTWQISGDHLIQEKKLTGLGQFFDITVTNWLQEIGPAEREKLIDGIYQVLISTNLQNMTDLFNLRNSVNVMKAIARMDDETQKLLKEVTAILLKSMRKAIPEAINDSRKL